MCGGQPHNDKFSTSCTAYTNFVHVTQPTNPKLINDFSLQDIDYLSEFPKNKKAVD